MAKVGDLVSALELETAMAAQAPEGREEEEAGVVEGETAGDGDAVDPFDAVLEEEERLLEESREETSAIEKKLADIAAQADELEAMGRILLEQIDALSGMPHGCSSYYTNQDSEIGGPESVASGPAEEFIVKQILGKKGRRYPKSTEYLCVWSPGGALTWEKDTDIEAIALVEAYEEMIKEKWRALVARHNESRRKARDTGRTPGRAQSQISQRKIARRRELEVQRNGGAPVPPAPVPQAANNDQHVAYDNEGNRRTLTRGPPTQTEAERLMHLDIPALRRYLETVVDFTPLHYELLLRLSEDDVSRGASEEALTRIVIPSSEQFAAHKDACGSCSVCLDTIEEQTEAAALPCTHIFHDDCIRGWFKNEKTCPLCKTEL